MICWKQWKDSFVHGSPGSNGVPSPAHLVHFDSTKPVVDSVSSDGMCAANISMHTFLLEYIYIYVHLFYAVVDNYLEHFGAELLLMVKNKGPHLERDVRA